MRSDSPTEATESGMETDAAATIDATEADNDSGFKRSMLWRAGIAAVLILMLLAGLMLFDEANTRDNQTAKGDQGAKGAKGQSGEMAEAPIRLAPPEPSADLQVPPLTDELEAEELLAQLDQQDQQDMADADVEELSAAPEFNLPDAAATAPRPLTQPATARQAALKSQVASRADTTGTAATPATATAKTPTKSSLRQEARTAIQRQSAEQAQAAAASDKATPATPVTTAGKGYLLQLGVFNNPAHAEDLRARLERNGIPVQLETRVRVGPFATREEIEQMRDKLRQLGLQDSVLVATKNN